MLFDPSQPLDISIPIKDGKDNPNCYQSDNPSIVPVIAGDFVGSVAEGGPCNHKIICLTPHGNGTHTECVGHISADPKLTLNRCLTKFFFKAQLITVTPLVDKKKDKIITWSSLQPLLHTPATEALIIRTLPNSAKKLTANYSGSNPPYLETGVAKKLAQNNLQHLLVDLPSIDREEDEGRLQAHRDFWNYPEKPRINCTISELVYVPDTIQDGNYLLNLQVISLESDASPSKPVLYRQLPAGSEGVEII